MSQSDVIAPPIEVTGVSFSYGRRQVLRNVSFTCAPGETLGLLGSSGTGKTTILNLICGLLRPEWGTVRVEGRLPQDAVRDQRVGYLLQRPTLYPWLTALENVALPLVLRRRVSLANPFRKLSRIEQARAAFALRVAKVVGVEEKYPHELSGGMQTRVALARTLSTAAQILLLDEPFNALDDALKSELYRDFQEMGEIEHATKLVVTHNIMEAVILCDRIIVVGRPGEEGGSTIVLERRVDLPRPRNFEILGNEALAPLVESIRASYFATARAIP